MAYDEPLNQATFLTKEQILSDVPTSQLMRSDPSATTETLHESLEAATELVAELAPYDWEALAADPYWKCQTLTFEDRQRLAVEINYRLDLHQEAANSIGEAAILAAERIQDEQIERIVKSLAADDIALSLATVLLMGIGLPLLAAGVSVAFLRPLLKTAARGAGRGLMKAGQRLPGNLKWPKVTGNMLASVDTPKQLAKLSKVDKKKNTKQIIDFIETAADNIGSEAVTVSGEEEKAEKSGVGQTAGSGRGRTELLAAGFELASKVRLIAAITRYYCQLLVHYQGNLTFADANEILNDLKPTISLRKFGQRRASLSIACEALFWSLSLPLLDFDLGVPGERLPDDAPDEVKSMYSQVGSYPAGGLMEQITYEDAELNHMKTNFTDPARAWAELNGTEVPPKFNEWHDEYILIAYLKEMRSLAFEKGFEKGLEGVLE